MEIKESQIKIPKPATYPILELYCLKIEVRGSKSIFGRRMHRTIKCHLPLVNCAKTNKANRRKSDSGFDSGLCRGVYVQCTWCTVVCHRFTLENRASVVYGSQLDSQGPSGMRQFVVMATARAARGFLIRRLCAGHMKVSRKLEPDCD